MIDLPQIELWCDGACSGNPGIGGYAALVIYRGKEKQVVGTQPHTTNNLMELTALREGLKLLRMPCRVKVFTDSRLVIGWLRDGWKRNDAGCAIVSGEIERIAQENGHALEFEHVEGHAGNSLNERVNALAQNAVRDAKIEQLRRKQREAQGATMEMGI